MVGLLLGLCCGGLELWLLRRLVNSIIDRQQVAFWLLPVKTAVLAAFGVPVGFFYSHQLLPFAIGCAGVLILGAMLLFLLRLRREGGKADG